MLEDENVLDRYNKGNFDVDEEKWIHYLSADRYDIENFNITIPAGERTGRDENQYPCKWTVFRFRILFTLSRCGRIAIRHTNSTPIKVLCCTNFINSLRIILPVGSICGCIQYSAYEIIKSPFVNTTSLDYLNTTC
jgi:hypothetical protein